MRASADCPQRTESPRRWCSKNSPASCSPGTRTELSWVAAEDAVGQAIQKPRDSTLLAKSDARSTVLSDGDRQGYLVGLWNGTMAMTPEGVKTRTGLDLEKHCNLINGGKIERAEGQ